MTSSSSTERPAHLALPPLEDQLGPDIDPTEAEFRVNSARMGAWLTVMVCVPALIYTAFAPLSTGRRDLVLGTWVIALLSGVGAFFLPWAKIVRSRWREAAFLTWSLLDVLLIVFVATQDGGPDSPVLTLLYLPIIFGGATYPTWSVNLLSASALTAYGALAVTHGTSWYRAVLVLAGIASVALMSWWHSRNHERRRRELSRASITDPLTGCLNRRGFSQAAARGLAALDRHELPLALMIIDLDNFKSYNDAHGHQAGDELLVWLAQQISSTLRPIDSLARIGGDEFAVLLSGSDYDRAERVAGRIQEACRTRVSHSIGISSAPESGRDFDSLYRAADRELYAAKDRRRMASRLSVLVNDMGVYGV